MPCAKGEPAGDQSRRPDALDSTCFRRPARAIMPPMAQSLPNAQTVSYTLSRDHSSDEGIRQIPLAGPLGSASCAIIRLHRRVEAIVIHWTATRLGAPPIVPAPIFDEPNLVFLGGGRSVAAPMPDLDGKSWSISGVHRYAVRNPVGLQSQIATGRMPFDPSSPEMNAIEANYFQRGILGNNQFMQNPLLFEQTMISGPGG